MKTSSDHGYRVLARVYRPQKLSDLIGQDAAVETIRNAFESDRIAHAFLMTGVRGVGKTTIARIIAKGLNCVGPDEQGSPDRRAVRAVRSVQIHRRKSAYGCH